MTVLVLLQRRSCPGGQSLAVAKDGEPRSCELKERRVNDHDLLRKQARRYNDLRVAYESLSRLLQNNGYRCNVRNTAVGTTRGARSTGALGIESSRLHVRSHPDLRRGATKMNSEEKSKPVRGQRGGSNSAIEPAVSGS